MHASVLTGAPRAATSPLNAMRNYLFASMESEARLALDATEPVRADVDAFLLDLLEDRVFIARDSASFRTAFAGLPHR
ncbi:MAG: hypothetical protein WCB99_10785 [Candidatus Cybelea sp.]